MEEHYEKIDKLNEKLVEYKIIVELLEKIDRLTCRELKEELKSYGLVSGGLKNQKRIRLESYLKKKMNKMLLNNSFKFVKFLYNRRLYTLDYETDLGDLELWYSKKRYSDE